MRIDRSHFSWFVFTLIATLIATLLYEANFHPENLPFHVPLPGFLGEVPPTRLALGATPLGLIFGILSFAIFLFASALGIRKRRRLWPIGATRVWLKAHIWLTILTIPLILYHCGFHMRGGFARWLMVLYGIVMVSGFIGLAFQQYLPRLMKERLPREVVFEEIPHLRRELFKRAQGIRETLRTGPEEKRVELEAEAVAVMDDTSVKTLSEFIDEDVLPYLAAEKAAGRLTDAGRAAQIFRMVKMSVAKEWQEKVDSLEDWCKQRRWTDLQTQFQRWLHGWLLIHIPVSLALLILTAWHAWQGLRFLIVPT